MTNTYKVKTTDYNEIIKSLKETFKMLTILNKTALPTYDCKVDIEFSKPYWDANIMITNENNNIR